MMNDEQTMHPNTLSEKAGIAAGMALGLGTGAMSFFRKSRMFHPRGSLWSATVTPHSSEVWSTGTLPTHALVRFSSALWKTKEWPDVLGVAIRFTQTSTPTVTPIDGDQDILFATILAPILTPAGPLTTKFWTFLDNPYYAVSPFELPNGETAYLRLRATYQSQPQEGSRLERLTAATEKTLILESNPHRIQGEWTLLAEIHLREVAELDQETLRFSPFRDGKNFKPKGFIHALRVGAYAFSQSARPKKSDKKAKAENATPQPAT